MIIPKKEIEEINEQKIIDQIRSLGLDMVNEAKSGHPGIILDIAPTLYTLYAHFLKIDPKNPTLFNRDRFVMSAGHGSALLYSILYMAGYDIELEDLKKFRQISSKTPGHPEYMTTPGVDTSTGPLGQGFANAVGMAMAEAKLRTTYNKGKNELIDFYTYVLCSDGDLMEGVSYEAASLAGSLKLNKLIALYDSNNISIDGNTSLTFNENIEQRFTSQGWNYVKVNDGENIEEIKKAIETAKESTDKPTLIEIKTIIGKYSKYEGTNKVHSGPLDPEDISEIKQKLKVRDIPFSISKDTIEDLKLLINNRCKNISKTWDKKYEKLDEETKKEIDYLINDDKSIDFKGIIYETPTDLKESPGDTSSKILNSLSKSNQLLIGGSADLFASTKTNIIDGDVFSSNNYLGKNIYFGVREHAMASIINGMSLCGLRTYASTFLSFSDYMKPGIRMACMMNLPVTYIFTHDSISIGQDGPTHQPVEQLIGLRSTPNMEVFRPADANEVIGTYKTIMEKKKSPSVISLSKTTLPILTGTNANDVSKGGYIVFDSERNLSGIIIATGEELHLAIELAERLRIKGMDIRVVSMPCISRFLNQSQEYIDEILPVEVRKIVIEASSAASWNSIVFNNKYLITLDEFGKSGARQDVYKEYGFDIDSLEEKVENLLK